MAENPTFQIPRDVIEPIIQAHVATAVMNALDGYKSLLDGVVAGVMTAKVDRDGKLGGYGNDPTYIQWLLSQCVKDAVKETLVDELAKHKEAIKKSIVRQLKNEKSPLVEQLVAALTGALTDPDTIKYRLEVKLSHKEGER